MHYHDIVIDSDRVKKSFLDNMVHIARPTLSNGLKDDYCLSGLIIDVSQLKSIYANNAKILSQQHSTWILGMNDIIRNYNPIYEDYVAYLEIGDRDEELETKKIKELVHEMNNEINNCNQIMVKQNEILQDVFMRFNMNYFTLSLESMEKLKDTRENLIKRFQDAKKYSEKQKYKPFG